MTEPSLCYRVTAAVLALALFCLTSGAALKGQDISGGASADIASAGDLESRLGIGVFTNLQKDMFRRFLRQSATRQAILDLLDEADAGK